MGKKRPDHLRPFSTFCLVLFDGFRNRSRQLLHASPKAPTFDTLLPASMHSYPSYMAYLVNSILTHLRDFSLSKLLIFRCLWFLFLKNPLKSMVIFRFLL